MFHQSRCWIDLGELLLCGAHNCSVMIEANCSRARCALVQGKHILCHHYPSFSSRRTAWRLDFLGRTNVRPYTTMYQSAYASMPMQRMMMYFECIGDVAYARWICDGTYLVVCPQIVTCDDN